MEALRTLFMACVLAAFLGGCAGGNVVECHGVDWYQVGKRDASFDGKDESNTIAEGCGPAFDAARYREGFEAGMAQRRK
jgi:hypothetical protein